MTKCKHLHGAPMDGNWICGQCFERLDSRPTRYGMRPFPMKDADQKDLTTIERQEIIWQAEIKKSSEGTTLAEFINAIARRFKSRALDLSQTDALHLAIEALKAIGDEFGDPDHDWSRMSAIDIADEEMSYWDFEGAATNG